MERASWMFGSSRSSAKTNTPGAEVASWTSFAAAAPLADLDMRRNCSSRAVELAMMSVWIKRVW